MTLNVSKTLLVLSASVLLVATCAALAKTGTVQRVGPVFPQRALTIEEFPELFTVVPVGSATAAVGARGCGGSAS
jgi:hypothetical protein